jgi:hypothetical protein
MEMINRSIGNALDAQRMIDRIVDRTQARRVVETPACNSSEISEWNRAVDERKAAKIARREQLKRLAETVEHSLEVRASSTIAR